MRKIRKGDEVVVLSGRDKGSRGRVLRFHCGRGKDPDRIVVEGVNRVKRHTKPNPNENQPGGIIDREAPIHISKVAIYNPVTGKPDRIGLRFLENGGKVRFFKSNGEVLETN